MLARSSPAGGDATRGVHLDRNSSHEADSLFCARHGGVCLCAEGSKALQGGEEGGMSV